MDYGKHEDCFFLYYFTISEVWLFPLLTQTLRQTSWRRCERQRQLAGAEAIQDHASDSLYKLTISRLGLAHTILLNRPGDHEVKSEESGDSSNYDVTTPAEPLTKNQTGRAH